MIDYGHWDTSLVGIFNPKDYYGFIYLVTNIKTGKAYIGKKSMWAIQTKQIDKIHGVGKKNVRLITESAWGKYTTSSKYINAEISLGEKFTFQIISLHTNKGTLAYNEVMQMIQRDVLRTKFPDGTRSFYNRCVPGIKFLPSAEVSPEAMNIVREKSIRRTKKITDRPRKGKPCSEETKEKLRKHNTGKVMPQEIRDKCGRPQSIESRKRNSDRILNRTPEERERIGSKISASNTGKIKSEETKKKISDTKKNQPEITCPHCGKIGPSSGGMKRYHFNNCKLKKEI